MADHNVIASYACTELYYFTYRQIVIQRELSCLCVPKADIASKATLKVDALKLKIQSMLRVAGICSTREERGSFQTNTLDTISAAT